MSSHVQQARAAAQNNGPEAAKAFEAALDGTKRVVARKFADNKDTIAALLNIPKEKLDNETLAGMAISWVENESFKVGETTYDRAALKTALRDRVGKLAEFRTLAGKIAGKDLESDEQLDAFIDNALPKGDAFVLPARLLSEEVKRDEEHRKEEGFWSKLVKVLSWLFSDFGGFFGRLGELIKWGFGSGFSEDAAPKELKDRFAGEAAQRVSSNFGTRMREEVGKRPDMRALVTGRDIADMQREVHNGVLDAANGKESAALTPQGLAGELAARDAQGPRPQAVTMFGMPINPESLKEIGRSEIEKRFQAFLDTPAVNGDPKNYWQQMADATRDQIKKENPWTYLASPTYQLANAERAKAKVMGQLNPTKVREISRVAMDGLWEGAMGLTDAQLADADKDQLAAHLGKSVTKALSRNKQWQNGIEAPVIEGVVGNAREQVTNLVTQYHDQIKDNRSLISELISKMKGTNVVAAPRPGAIPLLRGQRYPADHVGPIGTSPSPPASTPPGVRPVVQPQPTRP